MSFLTPPTGTHRPPNGQPKSAAPSIKPQPSGPCHTKHTPPGLGDLKNVGRKRKDAPQGVPWTEFQSYVKNIYNVLFTPPTGTHRPPNGQPKSAAPSIKPQPSGPCHTKHTPPGLGDLKNVGRKRKDAPQGVPWTEFQSYVKNIYNVLFNPPYWDT